MSDYMFMLENHLSPAQARVVAELRTAAGEANLNLFLTGGAVRDMLAGFPIRDLDFTLEGNPAKVVKAVVARTGAEVVSSEEGRKSYHLAFPGGVRSEVSMARQERYAKPGGKPQVTPSTIHEDLQNRDFTVNALALSLNRASKGLLLDPTNGLGDLERRELRAIGNYALYDVPVRILRLLRLRARLHFQIAERTESQYRNAREAGIEKYVSGRALLEELEAAASEPNPAEVLQAWHSEKLLEPLLPFLTAEKLNPQGFAKLLKARQVVTPGTEVQVDDVALFFYFLAEKLSAKERASLIAATGMAPEVVQRWQKLEARASKVEKEAASAKLTRPSRVYGALSKTGPELLIFLLVKSTQRSVQDRIRNYFQKYLPAALEIHDRQVIEAGATAGTAKFQKLKSEMINKRLDARPKKPPVEVVEDPPAGAPGRPPGPGSNTMVQPSARPGPGSGPKAPIAPTVAPSKTRALSK